MTETDAISEQPPAKQRRHAYIAIGVNAVLLVFSVIAVISRIETAGNIGIFLWVVALAVTIPTLSIKTPELKKLVIFAMILFLIATIGLFVAFAMSGTYDSLDLF